MIEYSSYNKPYTEYILNLYELFLIIIKNSSYKLSMYSL